MIKVIITGVTGMVGEGVLHECVNSPDVESICVLTRRSLQYHNDKIKEIVVEDFNNLASVEEELKGYDACFFCAGVSSLGMKESEYSKITYDITLNVANVLLSLNSEMTFNYVSGAATDSSEKGRTMWARVKGKTENDLMKLPFKSSYMFRPGYIQPIKGLKNANKFYKIFAPFYPLWKILFPRFVCTLEDVGKSMIKSVTLGYQKQILECSDITALAQR